MANFWVQTHLLCTFATKWPFVYFTQNFIGYPLTEFRYQIGEVFVHSSVEDTNGMLEKAKERLDTEIAELETKCEAHKETLSQLKVQLYANFGSNINLEADDE